MPSGNVIIDKELYCQFLIASQERYSLVGLSELMPNGPAHDSYTRWLSGKKLPPKILWEYAEPMVNKESGFLILDDTVLDKWYGPKIEPALPQYSGRHHRVVNGIDVVNLLWNGTGNPETAEHIPIDFRMYDPKRDGKTKNQHAHEMLELAFHKGFRKILVCADCAYSDLGTLKQIRRYDWSFVMGIKSNRIISLTPHHPEPVSSVATEEGVIGHLRGFGLVKVIKIVRPNRDIDYLVTNETTRSSPVIRAASDRRWKIEELHRGEKQTVGLEKCQSRMQRAQRNHILCSHLAFLATEKHRLEHGCSWAESQFQIIADALRLYLKKPFIPLPPNASAR